MGFEVGRHRDLSAVPESVSNYRARAVMREFKMADGRSLFTAVDEDLRDAVAATRVLDEFDEQRMAADLAWQAWEQANVYERRGRVTLLIAARYPEITSAVIDNLFRQADRVTA